ncbi:hypothetical protein JCM19274_1322 [Algibacter lectus]|uniref:Uncharacterized protein n=1 Tax=Algibacter lectus TaxID=221126 RepID=A0A090WUL0_9FLAO|nr:hypothetical protein JCM19274_1322 [Algibacter lectus]
MFLCETSDPGCAKAARDIKNTKFKIINFIFYCISWLF